MARVGIDGVTKQQQLHERNHYDHGKRDTVALELDELLHQHGPRLAPKTCAGKALRRLGRQQVRHWKSSCNLRIKSMNTSSGNGSECSISRQAAWKKLRLEDLSNRSHSALR